MDIIDGENRDWEDLTLIPSDSEDGADYLVAGDHGDNSAKRDHIDLYILPEPDPDGPSR